MGKGLSDADLKKQLYKWASKPSGSGGQILPGKDTYIYNTTAPVETSLGFEGYGILWWQLDGYERTTFHVFDDVGVPIYAPTLYINGSSVYLDEDEYYCGKQYITTYGYLLMLNTKNTYKAKATADSYTEETEQEINVAVGDEENHVKVGRRPEFILAINSNDDNGKTVKSNMTIPTGNYYIIASGGGGSGPAEPGGYWPFHKNGGGSGASFIGRVHLESDLSTKYHCEVGGAGTVHTANGHDGVSTILYKGSEKILETKGGIAGGPSNAGKGGNVSTNLTILNEYLNSKGNDGTIDGMSAVGATSTINDTSKNKLRVGIGKDRGQGGNNYVDEVFGEDKSGTGGCLYILSDASYCVVNIKVPDNSYSVTINVTGDSRTSPRESIINTDISVGTISGYGNQSFIVKKGATVNYTVSKEYYNTETGSFVVGETKTANNLNVGAIDSSNNEQTANIKLSKTILTHTITSNGANIKVSGKFMQNASSDGTVAKYTAEGTGTLTVYVWQGEPNIKIESVSKSYYNTLTNYQITAGSTKTDSRNLTDGSATISTNNTTTTVTLPKTKYYATNVSYSHSRNSWLYKWQKTGNLTKDDGKEDNAYTYGTQNAKITLSRTGLPENWIMYLDGCYGDSVGKPRIEVNINGQNKLSGEISKKESNNYTINGTGTNVSNVEIKFTGPKLCTTNFYIDSVYFIVND